MLCIQTASRAASRAPGCHTLGSTPIKITSLHFYLHLATSSYSSFSSPPSFSFPLSLTFNPLLSGGSHLCSMAEQWNPRGCLSCLGLDCWAPTMCSGRLAYNMPPLCNALIHRGTICPPPICSCIQHVTSGPLQRSHIHPNTQCSVIVQRATNEANYPKEPRAVVGDALTYIPVWPDCSFGQPT